LLGEKNRNIDQVGNRTDGERPEYRHSDGSNWAYCDGHVQYIKGPVPDDDPRWKWW
jgi:prepilin-type processing-associated H-X9-DG protein